MHILPNNDIKVTPLYKLHDKDEGEIDFENMLESKQRRKYELIREHQRIKSAPHQAAGTDRPSKNQERRGRDPGAGPPLDDPFI